MLALEQLLALFSAAVVLASAARRVGAPYPVFLALGGAANALPPELILALFVAPVLVDSAYDMRAAGQIGNDAFLQIEEELDWLEMALGDGADGRP